MVVVALISVIVARNPVIVGTVVAGEDDIVRYGSRYGSRYSSRYSCW